MNLILTLLFLCVFSASDGIRAEPRQFSLATGHVVDAGFPISFPQLYFFNAKGELFYVTGGGTGDAVGNLKTFAKGLDENKLQRMAHRPPVSNLALWSQRFAHLTKLLALPDDVLLSDARSVTLVGFILDPHDYPQCHPCKTLAEELSKLSQNENVSVVLITQKRTINSHAK